MGTERTTAEGFQQLWRGGDVLRDYASRTPVTAVYPRQTGEIVNFLNFKAQKGVFQGLFPQKPAEKNTQRVFGPVAKKFERENPKNHLKYSSNTDFTNFESQNFVEENTASGNTIKTFH